MRKLIIIGNGFDRAHGMLTSYGDFLKGYLLDAFIKMRESSNGVYEDQLIRIAWKDSNRDIDIEGRLKELNIENFNKFLFDLKEISKRTSSLAKIIINTKSSFFNLIYEEWDKNWVDIEDAYFRLLYQIRNQNDAVKKLNSDFEFIKTLLVEYLVNINIDNYVDDYNEMLFNQKTAPKTKYHILNFNYTNTIRKYLNENKSRFTPIIDCYVNNIHGELSSGKDGIIFGIGDEYHPNYHELKNVNNRLLYHSKSQWYLRTDNYRNLLNFIDEKPELVNGSELNPFDVEIYGHSCGSSDRTLLRYIFEHPNCQSIKVFYHEKEEHFFDLMLDLEKIFTDPILFRQKVLSLKSCEPMPQLPKEENEG